MGQVVVFGIGRWAELAYVYLTHDSPHDVAAFTVDREYFDVNRMGSLPVVPFDEVDGRYPPDEFAMFIPISFTRMNHARAERYRDAKQLGYRLISYVS